MSDRDDDDTIINSTQTELAMFLVIAFVVLLGFQVTNDGSVAGTGQQQQGQPAPLVEVPQDPSPTKELPPFGISIGFFPDTPEQPPSPEAPVETPAEIPKAPSLGQSAEKARLAVKSCKVKFSEERRAFVLDVEQTSATGGRRLLFAPGKYEISDDMLQDCLPELIQALLTTYKVQKDTTKHVVIQGHTSSEWNAQAGCTGVPGTKDPARQTFVAYKCNRLLSQQRADEIFEFALGYNNALRAKNIPPSIPATEFSGVFYTEGRSSLDLVRDAADNELKPQSRRVEFVFVPRD